jgi:hypothetical protein
MDAPGFDSCTEEAALIAAKLLEALDNYRQRLGYPVLTATAAHRAALDDWQMALHGMRWV